MSIARIPSIEDYTHILDLIEKEDSRVSKRISSRFLNCDTELACAYVTYGVSKIVIIPDGADYVFKIPKPVEEYFDRDDEDCSDDYCSLEAEFYSRAIEQNVAHMFAGTFRIHDTLYYSERAEMDKTANKLKSTSKDSTEMARAMRNNYLKLDLAARFIEDYGVEETRLLISFIESQKIGDLHNGNIGFINNKIVLTDYSGYNGGVVSRSDSYSDSYSDSCFSDCECFWCRNIFSEFYS